MKAVTRIHTCIITHEVMQFVIQNAANIIESGGPGTIEQSLDFMQMPPPDRLINSRVVTPCHPLPNGSVLTRIEVTALEDEE